MDLMDMKRVHFLRAVFDDPVFNVALAGDDVGHGGLRIERFLGLPLNREHEDSCTAWIIWILRPFGEIKMARADGLSLVEGRRSLWRNRFWILRKPQLR